MEGRMNKLDFFKLFLEQKSKMEGASRKNLIFLIETLRKLKQLEHDLQKISGNLDELFSKAETKTKNKIETEMKIVENQITKFYKRQKDFYQEYFGKI